MNAAPGPSSSTLTTAPPPRPPSSKGSHRSKRPPDKPNVPALDEFDASVSAEAAKKAKGKGKAREIVDPTRQDLEVEEDVRRMDAERERLRVREVQAQSQATLAPEFKDPLLPPSSIPRRRQTGFAVGTTPTTPGGTVIDMTQPIPLRDTPTIDRNRVMRGEPVERRRSSLSRRGKRASSSFEHTGIIREDILLQPLYCVNLISLAAQPHPSVSTANFHKHIDRELPEAHRARHLLVWCASRTSARTSSSSSSKADNPPLPPLTAEGATILQEVQKEVQKMLTEQRIDISFSSRIEVDGDRPTVRQHEQNAKNLKREDDFMRHIDRLVFRLRTAWFYAYFVARCKRESDAWTSVIQLYNARQASTVDALSRQRHQSGTSTEWIPPESSDPLHERELQGAQLARRCNEKASRKQENTPLSLRLAEIESKVDRAHSSLHISQQLTNRATRHLDKRFEALASALAARSQPTVQPSEVSTLANLMSGDVNATSATGMGAPPDTLDILRALARTDVERPRQEVGEAARKAVRDVQRMNATGTPGRGVAAAAGVSGGGTSVGERRLTAVTPRAAPGTPRRPGTPRQKSEGVGGGNGS